LPSATSLAQLSHTSTVFLATIPPPVSDFFALGD
jgi:hypothetical protein